MGGWAKGLPFEAYPNFPSTPPPPPPTFLPSPPDEAGTPLWWWYWTDRVIVPPGVTLSAVGIGSGPNADMGQLSQRCSGTGGGTFNHDDQSLDERFFKLQKFLTAVWMQDVLDQSIIADPIATVSPGEVFSKSFRIESSYTSLIVVIYDKEDMLLPFYLLSPHQERIASTNLPAGYSLRIGFTKSARFVEVLLPTDNEERIQGEWKLKVAHDRRVYSGDFGGPDGAGDGFVPSKARPFEKPVAFAYLIGGDSQFRMRAWLGPTVVKIGESILATVELSEFDAPVTKCDVSVTVTAPNGDSLLPLELLDDGQHEDGAADDGRYARRFFTDRKLSGFYRFHFRAERQTKSGQTEVREAVIDKYVEDPDHSTKPDMRHPPGENLSLLAKNIYQAVTLGSVLAAVTFGLVFLSLMLVLVWLRLK